jgi:hypothetical protein
MGFYLWQLRALRTTTQPAKSKKKTQPQLQVQNFEATVSTSFATRTILGHMGRSDDDDEDASSGTESQEDVLDTSKKV